MSTTQQRLDASTPPPPAQRSEPGPRYKWVALSNTTLGVFMAVLDGSIVIIALPAIFRGIGLDPLAAGNRLPAVDDHGLPAGHHGSGGGARQARRHPSIGVFFSLMIIGLAASLPHTLTSGLQAQGVPASVADGVATLPPVATLFAAFLGQNPIAHLLAPSGVLHTLPAHNAAVLTGNSFFPHSFQAPSTMA